MGGEQEPVLSSPETLSTKNVLTLKEEVSFLSSLLWAAELEISVFCLIYRGSVITLKWFL